MRFELRVWHTIVLAFILGGVVFLVEPWPTSLLTYLMFMFGFLLLLLIVVKLGAFE